MARRRNSTPVQIITKLREAEILLSQGKSVKRSQQASGDQRTDLLSLAQRVQGNGCHTGEET
jgi:ATP/maltotriose-dependent transcriptional regulator MalT